VSLLVFLTAACGQIGGTHQVPLGPVIPAVAGDQTAGLEPGSSFGGDTEVGGARGTPIAGDSTDASSSVGRVGVQQVTTTTTKTYVPQNINPALNNPNGPLYVCPVQGEFRVGDDFGAPRYAGGYHPHAGNDIFAPEGTPVVAPFDGTAENAANTLGGNAVIVRGADGYVYNAHLSAYGKLGFVHTGDVIGYVGNTGDAISTPTHDHFEWHPYNGGTIAWVGPYGDTTVDSGSVPAVDPFPYLYSACKGGSPPTP
jgi:murein DD-endopeptidase MepM/ murein hydrolase activator NlpD